MYSLTDQYLTVCWKEAFGNRDSIYISEIFTLLHELLDFVGTTSLFTKHELGLLQTIANNQSQLRLKKLEARDFLLKLSNFKSFEELLRSRSRTDISSLQRLLDNYPNRQGKTVKIELDNTSWFGNWWKYGKRSEKEPKREKSSVRSERETDYSYGTRQARDSYSERDDTDRFLSHKIKTESETYRPNDLFRSFRTEPEPYRNDLFRKIKKEPEPYRAELFRNDISIPGSYDVFASQEDRIQDLETLCAKYRRELEDKRVTDDQVRLVEKLKQTMEEKDRYIRDLRTRLYLGESPGFLARLPFIRQYIRIFNNDRRTIGGTIVECVTLMLSFVILVNVLKLVYYSVLTLAKVVPHGQVDVWDDELEITFSWLQQLPWLEYKVYQLELWMYG